MMPRSIALWSSAETRARVYGFGFLVSQAAVCVSGVIAYQATHRPREVVRIGCDGIPALVRIDDRVYSEPDDREIRAFVVDFTVKFMRADSYSVVNDAVDAARKMAPKLREAFKRAARGSADRPGTIGVIESLKRRTQIDPASLDLNVDKTVYPWRVTVKGVRQIIGQGESANQPFELGIDLVRTDRNEVIEGLLVWGVIARGEQLGAIKAE